MKSHPPRFFDVQFFIVDLVRGLHSCKHGQSLAIAAQPNDFLHDLLAMRAIEPILKATMPFSTLTSGDVP